MQKFILVAVFTFSLFLKVVTASGAESEWGSNLVAMKKTTTTTVETTDDEKAVEEQKEEPKEIAKKEAEQTSRIQNNINVNTPAAAPVATAPQYGDASSVLGVKAASSENTQRIAIIPMVGASSFNGSWYSHVQNAYSLGIAIELPVSNNFSFEVETGYAKYNVSYAYFSHDFNQFSAGLNGKYYFSRSALQPYIGAGMTAIDYDNMSYGPMSKYQSYSRWIGAAEALAGVDVSLSQSVAIGARGEWLLPVINRPNVANNGRNAMPYSEEASLINNTQLKFMGTARVAF